MSRFILAGLEEMFRGRIRYRVWIIFLLAGCGFGVWNYRMQLQNGLVVTGLSDQVSWGLYIGNFAFMVGIAASAVLLVIPAYLFHREDFRKVVLLGEAMAVAAVLMAMLFVVVDLGRPDRMWHGLPFLGRLNFPLSLLAWDIIVLAGYLLLNIAIPFYVLHGYFAGKQPGHWIYFVFIIITIVWAISIHTVTAFVFSANPARPFWHSALLGPRFIVSAFASGPALVILALQAIGRLTDFRVHAGVITTLTRILTVTMQINLFFVGVELFTDFYNEQAHAASARYLYLGLDGLAGLRGWIGSALVMNGVATAILTIDPLRSQRGLLTIACVLGFFGIWIEKGIGLVVPGFIPTPLGEVFEYTPTSIEIGVSMGVLAFGTLVFTLLAKAAIGIEQGKAQRSLAGNQLKKRSTKNTK
uniref:Prokaryotic molybdopterin-containing oxidoreductase family, membrane subunit n=1 Tax=Candidatus Kentrum sp. FM TaxID=2126340 RepID=A0A450S6I9_9GAMM|nr:MAG: prokaryotic molybdopterin-containing oxidoreductase family, membrane subunit [Candidatus Kentron sp. FM]VFJ47520.1 MAG: prokaryotic molybdopterin-containing oxidoreductase family, membrane subunit [Candidatus Kentron sp. FM]VFK07813.1 MAG: prokaryotic molybdopterin-containing oxidoreductase family, membrane subunit [Candidatus Kentron sp. FM]